MTFFTGDSGDHTKKEVALRFDGWGFSPYPRPEPVVADRQSTAPKLDLTVAKSTKGVK